MDKIIKLTSQQGFAASWTNADTPQTLNLVDFVIPRGMNVDLSRSYMSFNSQINNITNDTAINARWSFPSAATGKDYNVPTSVLVKNISVRNDRGLVESVRKVDTLSCGLWGLTNSSETRKNDLNTFSKFVNGRGVGNYTSLQLDCVTDNTAPNGTDVNTLHVSKNVSRDIKVPLKDVLGIGAAEAYSTDIFGETRIHAELNIKELLSEHLGGAEQNNNMFDGATKYGAMVGDNVQDGANFGTELISSGTYGDWQYVCPFFVGAQIIVNGDASPTAGGATVAFTLTTTITSMKYQTNNTKLATGADPNTNFAKVIITTADEIYNNTSGVEQTIDNILINYDAANINLQNVINRAELCLYTIPNDGDMPTSLTYPTYTTQEDNGNGLQSFNRQYMLEPEADAFLVALCFDDQILPVRDNLFSYRYDIDQIAQTGDRDVLLNNGIQQGSSLQYERLQRCLDSQIEVGFRNAHLRFYENSEADQTAVYGNNPISMICETASETADSKMLNLNIETFNGGTDGVNKLILYKHMYKTI